MGLRRAAQVAGGILLASLLLAAVHTEDGQFHFFPGGVGGPGAASVLQFSTGSNGVDDSVSIQAAIDSLPRGGTLIFPAGTYIGCNLILRSPYLTIIGAGKDSTVVQATAACTNLFLQQISSPFVSTAGPLYTVSFSDLTLKAGAATLSLVNILGRDVARFRASNMALNVGNVGDAQGLNLQGINDIRIENVECYSTVPGHGKCFVLTNSPTRPILRNNTCKWIYTCFEWGTGGTDSALFDSNTIMQGWPFLPTKVSNSGGTVTYVDGVLTDTSATFSGLCNDDGAAAPQTCTGNLGNHVRVMTPIVTRAAGNVNFNSGGSVLTDAGGNFVANGVKEGDIVRTASICRDNGAVGPILKQTCTAPVGTNGWGDRCDCTTNADCASGVCEPRFTFVIAVPDATHLRTYEWMSDTDRRATTAPLQPAYTVYSWVTCSVGSFTATAITCAATTGAHFKKWDLGTVTTPSNGTLYEVETRHPNYAFLEQSAATNSQITNNYGNWNFSDNVFTTGDHPTVIGNRMENCWDHCFNLQGNRGVFSSNRARHFGARGVANFSPNSVMDDTIGMDGPITATGSSNCPIVIGFVGASSATTANSFAINTVTLATSTSGICVQNNSDGVVLNNARCQGTFTTSCIRNDAATNVNTFIQNYHGETISNNGGTFTIEGGKTTQALGTANAAQNGSYFGCSDCTVANPCAAAGTGAVAKRQGGAWVCN
jgi:hypothetical protein